MAVSYPGRSSLARLIISVELVLGIGIATHALARTEPEPRAQLQLPRGSSFQEGQNLLAAKKWAEAVIVLRTVAKNNPGFTPAALGLARALTYSGRREEALFVLLQAADRETRDRRESLVRRARVLSRLFLTNVTLQLYQDGLSLMGSQRFAAAREKFDAALEQEPDNVELLTRSGQCLALDGDYDSAVERLRLARRLNPHEPEIRLWLGHSMHQRGELRDAGEELKAAYAELKRTELATLWHADLLFMTGQKKQAMSILEANSRVNPSHLMTLLSLVKYRLRLLGDEADQSALWSARKELQLVNSRLLTYPVTPGLRTRDDLGIELNLSKEELKSQAAKLLQQVEDRLEESNST